MNEIKKAVAGYIKTGGAYAPTITRYINEGEAKLYAGRFVALGGSHGVKALSAPTDTIAGVVPNSLINVIEQGGGTLVASFNKGINIFNLVHLVITP